MRNLLICLGSTAIGSLIVVGSWEAIAGNCPAISPGCSTNIPPPCSGTNNACSLIAVQNPPPDGTDTCEDGSSATYWSATAPTAWQDCVTQNGAGTCTRKSVQCEAFYLYASGGDCEDDNYCLMGQDYECTMFKPVVCSGP